MSAPAVRAAILQEHPDFGADALGGESWARLGRLADASPLYAQELLRDPSRCLWLEEARNLREPYRFRALLDTWEEFAAAAPLPQEADLTPEDARLGRLRRWRRLMSMRIAHRSVNELADEPATVEELTRLAEFCLRECWLRASAKWTARLGVPWDAERNEAARFCVLALGKLGGRELNFSSDIDLIYLCEGEGTCRRDGAPTTLANIEWFTKVAETVTAWLNARTRDGFLFRVDLRLRPDGETGPLVHSLSSLENYYVTAGQTWERLAMLKARPVAADLALGAEFLEDMHSFRYPRRPPPSLLGEVAAMKARGEAEIVGQAALERNVKLGRGGIREIEFIAQSLQLLHAGRYPFLQTHSTADALRLLARYGLIAASDAAGLEQAYWFLRRVEHRLQMRDENQTHSLPADPAELAAVAASLGFPSTADLQGSLEARRQFVHRVYAELFADKEGIDPEHEDWWTFFTTERIPPSIGSRIARWFGDTPGSAEALRLFACGDRRTVITRELVTRFRHLARNFDTLMPELATPLATLARLARFAERYGTRQHFLGVCADNSQLLRVLALLCDRSEAVVDLLCAHPEIFEEVVRPENLRRRKSARELDAEIAAGDGATDPKGWLRLYIRAELVRTAIGALLGDLDTEKIEAAITRLADAVLRRLCSRSGVLVVALGKYGGSELAFGSDLDLIFVAPEGGERAAERLVDGVRAAMGHEDPLGPAFAIDLRLRPHGESGPAATSIAALASYHEGGGAQPWEKQALLRARTVTGPARLSAEFEAWTERLLYAAPAPDNEMAALWSMLGRIERERGAGPAGLPFKAGPGGLVEIEFLIQSIQLRHGHAHPPVRLKGSRAALRAAAAAGLIPEDAAAQLLDNFAFLKRIEISLRLNANRPVGRLEGDPAGRTPVSRWLGFASEADFWREHLRRLSDTRRIVREAGGAAARASLPPLSLPEPVAGP